MQQLKIVTVLTFLLFFMIASGTSQNTKTYKYIAFGDSYTICTGAEEKESWPVLLCKHLKAQKVNMELIANPSRNGYSTQNLIDNELLLLDKNEIDFATLLIGVNDYVRGVNIKSYEKNLIFIIDQIQAKLSDKQKLILITIPDFGVTPQGSKYGNPQEISKGISAFNSIIKNEAVKRNLKYVDLFEISKQMGSQKDLVSADGLHVLPVTKL